MRRLSICGHMVETTSAGLNTGITLAIAQNIVIASEPQTGILGVV
jgi:hypothetical protein